MGVLSVPFAHTTHLIQVRAFCVNGPSVWPICQSSDTSLPSNCNPRFLAVPPELLLLSRTISDTFYRRLKTLLFDRAGVGSASEYSGLEEALYTFLNE